MTAEIGERREEQYRRIGLIEVGVDCQTELVAWHEGSCRRERFPMDGAELETSTDELLKAAARTLNATADGVLTGTRSFGASR